MRFTVFAYCFAPQYNNLLEYRIDVLGDSAFQLTKILLNKDYEEVKDLKKFQFTRRSDAFTSIVKDLDQIETSWNIIIADDTWDTMAKNFERAMDTELGSVTVVGNLRKYGPDTNGVHSFLSDHGYTELRSKPPYFYVLDEFHLSPEMEKSLN